MGYQTEAEVVNAMIKAYYEERDVEKVLEYVTEQVEWIGTEASDYANGKEELRKLLIFDMQEFPDSFAVEAEQPTVHKLTNTVSRVSIRARQVPVPGVVCGFSIRGSACCIKQEDGSWLIESMHASVPNSELEKYSLTQELDEIRKKEQTLMSTIPGGTAIYRLKKDGHVEMDYVSMGFARMLGYRDVNELLKRAKHNALDEIPEEEHASVMGKVHESLEEGKPISVFYHIYTKDGSKKEVVMDANVISEGKLLPDDVAILYAVHTAVSEESQRARLEQQHYRMILDMTDTAYFEWDRDTGFYYSEKFAEYAISKGGFGAIMGDQSAVDSIYPDDLAKLQEYLTKSKDREKAGSVVARMKMQDGTYRWTEVTGYVDFDEKGEFNRLIGVMRDVNPEWREQNMRLKEALEVAEHANRAKTDFLSRVSHDMRTPLNGILGTTVLLQDYVTDIKIKKDLSQLEQSGRYLLNLINDTLDVSKIESGKLELNPEVCDGRSVFNNVLALVAPNIKEKKIQFHVHAENLPFTMLYIDVGRVEQIVMNVLGNAVKFTPEGGNIHFYMTNLSVENGVILDRVVIEDDGVGMSKEFLPRLFEPFSQEHNTSTSSSQGTGLGMTITKQIIDLMGGEINVESEEGKGTRFTFTLPLPIAEEEQVKEWKKHQNTELTGHTLENRRILLCEDHPLNANIAKRLLQNKGMVVEHAVNGKEGLEKFRASEVDYYDAVLMDIRMPVMNGIDATKAIRRLDRKDAATIPIIAMTANAFNEDIKETAEAGMNAHLSKPVETAKLFETLENLIKRRNAYIRPKVLVVDDVKINRAVVKEAIRDQFDVVEAEDGLEALEIFQREKGIDAVITDIQMPKMDGITLIQKIREKDAFRHLAIITNTQYGAPEQEEMLLKLGANDFVYKPTTPKIIEMRLLNVLRKI